MPVGMGSCQCRDKTLDSLPIKISTDAGDFGRAFGLSGSALFAHTDGLDLNVKHLQVIKIMPSTL